MIVSSPARAVGAAVLVGGLVLGGCSSEKDVPPTVASAPNGGTQVNTDAGSGGTFPDINSVPNQRPTSTIQDLNTAPEGLSGAPGGGQYGDALVGGPTSSAPPPPPPPPPPPEQQLAPIAESADQTQNASIPPAPVPTPPEPAAEAPAAAAAPEEVPEPAEPEAAAPEESQAVPSEPIATPEIEEPEPMEPATDGEPQYGEAAPAPEPAAPAPQDQGGEGQTIVAQAPQTQPAEPAADAAAAAPVPAPESTPPAQPETQVAAAPPAPAPSAAAQPQTAPAYGQSIPASSPEAYGISPPNPASPPYRPAGNSGAANYAAAAPSPPYATHGEPLGLIYFGEGSYALSPDDRDVLVQIANMQRIYGGVVHVVGHASMATGAAEANQRISAARAQAVADQLMQFGVPRDAIQVIAAGDAQPLYSETAPSGEAGNRRADVYLGAY